MNDFYADPYSIHATEKDDRAYSNHLYDMAGGADKENDLKSKPF